MRYQAPSESFHARVDGFATGLVGTIGVRILAADGSTITARTTAHIIENPSGSGSYLATLTAPAAAGEYTIFWDSGSITPGTTTGEQLLVTYSPLAPAPTGAFVSADDLAARLGLTFTESEASRATTLLAFVTDLIRQEAKQTISLVTDEVLTIPGTTDERILLPQRPVVSVSSVTLNGTAIAEGVWYLVGNEIVRRRSSVVALSDLSGIGSYEPLLGGIGVGFGFEWQPLVITYTHGYAADAIPGVVKVICLEATVRAWVNPGSVARESVGNVSTVYDNMRFAPTGLLLTDDERAAIRRFFGRAARSITIGG